MSGIVNWLKNNKKSTSGLYDVLLMVSSNSNTIKRKKDSVEIALLCLSHYIHFLFQQQQTQKPRMSAIQSRKWLLTVLKLNLWQRPIVLPPCRQRVATSSASEGPAVLLQESHCFNYSCVITSINCNVFVNAGSPKKKPKQPIARKQKDGKTEITSRVVSLATSSRLWSPCWQILRHWPEGQLVIPAQRTGRWDCKACGMEFSRADLAAMRTQASIANPLYSSVNPHSCAHPVRTPVWACQRSPMELGNRAVPAARTRGSLQT